MKLSKGSTFLFADMNATSEAWKMYNEFYYQYFAIVVTPKKGLCVDIDISELINIDI